MWHTLTAFSSRTSMLSRLIPRSISALRSTPRAQLATATSYTESLARYPRTQTTVLSNGLTVATESHPGAHTATVGVWIDAGSRSETDKTNGCAHFLEHMAFKGTKERSQRDLEVEIENMGAHLNAYTSREQTVYYAKAHKRDVGKCVTILADILQNSKLDPAAIERERDVILREYEEVNKQMEEVVFDHLHATAYQGHALGRTILGPVENIRSIQRDDLAGYIKDNYTAGRMVLVATGAVDHNAVVKDAEKLFSTLPASATPSVALPHHAKPIFSGSEIKVRNDTLPAAHMALAVESVGWNHADYYPLMVLQAVVGSWERSLGASAHVSSPFLVRNVTENNLANSYTSFNTSYADSGLWGVYMVSENQSQLDDLMYVIQKEWCRLATALGDAEVYRAKQQLKAALLMQLDGTTAVAEELGRQLVTGGQRVEPSDVERLVEAVTPADVRRVAQEYLWDREVAVVGVGPVESMQDYLTTRGRMSWNRF